MTIAEKKKIYELKQLLNTCLKGTDFNPLCDFNFRKERGKDIIKLYMLYPVGKSSNFLLNDIFYLKEDLNKMTAKQLCAYTLAQFDLYYNSIEFDSSPALYNQYLDNAIIYSYKAHNGRNTIIKDKAQKIYETLEEEYKEAFDSLTFDFETIVENATPLLGKPRRGNDNLLLFEHLLPGGQIEWLSKPYDTFGEQLKAFLNTKDTSNERGIEW